MWDGRERRTNNSESLKELKKLTNGLPQLLASSDMYKEWKANGGSAFSWILHRVGNDLLVQRWFMSAGCHWDNHQHSGFEAFYTYEGKWELLIDDKVIVNTKDSIICVEPGKIHSAKFLEDTKTIVITAHPLEQRYMNGK